MTQPAQYISGRTVQEQMNELISYVDTRAAEVATDAIASDVAQVHQDMLDADADAQAAAASAAAAAGTLANAVKKTGEVSQSIAGDISVGGDLAVGGTAGFTGAVTVPTPTNNTDAATKKYVDDADALKISITDVNTYAVGLSGIQNVSGIKRFNNSFFYSATVSGLGAIELCRIPVVSNSRFFANVFTRYGSCTMDVTIDTDGSSTVTALTITKSTIKTTSIYASALYAYIDGTETVVCVGNAISANNYWSIEFLGALNNNNGAVINPNVTNTGTTRNVSGAVSAVIFP